MTPAITRPSHLWKSLADAKRQQAADVFWRDADAYVEHAEAIAGIAQRLKFRAKSVVALPVEKKVRYLLSIPVTELVAARLLIGYHLSHQRPMMGSFLDALGIKHDNGVIDEDETPKPTRDTLLAAASAIGATYPAEDVAIYLSTLLWQDPDAWGALADAPQRSVVATA